MTSLICCWREPLMKNRCMKKEYEVVSFEEYFRFTALSCEKKCSDWIIADMTGVVRKGLKK